jgi:peptidoglycan/xylan/chitin deacetylase (PgdA/CDA1 family)
MPNIVKTLAKKALVGTGILRLLANRRQPGIAILMYHSVMENPNLVADSLGGIVHSTPVFEKQMQLLARGFHPASLEEASRYVRGEAEFPKRPIVVTFDDGYRDNYEVALPILNRLGIPATFYVTVDCVERRTLPWPSRLRFSFRTTRKKIWVDPTGVNWSLVSPEERERAYLAACDEFCKLAGPVLEDQLNQTEVNLDAKISNESSRLMMDWGQVKTLVSKGHLVGSHTMTHPNLAFLQVEDVRRELSDSKHKIETRVGAPVQHVSYPCPALYPNWTQQTIDESESAGYKTAVTTADGLAYERDNPLQLKRLPPTKTVDGLRWNLESAFAGLPR